MPGIPARPAASRSPISYSATGSRSAGCRSRSRGPARSSAVLPVAYNERLEWTVRYVDAEAAAEFPFGAGLGYTTWALGTAVDASAYGGDTTAYGGLENAALAARLSNTGRRRGSTVVQLYARVRRPGLLPRKAVLAGFIRVTMGAGASEEIRVGIAADAIPGLGLAPGDTATVDLWLSLDGAGEPTAPTAPTASVRTVATGVRVMGMQGGRCPSTHSRAGRCMIGGFPIPCA